MFVPGKKSSQIACGLAFPLLAQAASSTSTESNPYAVLGLVFIVVSIIRRKHPIGGWLMYFLALMFSNIFFTLTFVAFNGSMFLPASWDRSTRYLHFILWIVPTFSFAIGLSIAMIGLLRQQESRWLPILKALLMAEAISELIFFLSNPLDVEVAASRIRTYNFALPSILLFYLEFSRRARLVFETKEWSTKATAPRF